MSAVARRVAVLEDQRVVVLVDEANFGGLCFGFGRRPDWDALRNFLANPDEGRQLVEMIVYIGYPPDRPEFAAKRTSKENFAKALEHRGFMVVTKEGKTSHSKTGYDANVDVLMAIDAMGVVADMRPDVVVLVTGDADFAHLARQVRRRGVRVEVAAVRENLGEMLKRSVNDVIDLSSVINRFRARSGDDEKDQIGDIDVLGEVLPF